MAKCHCINRSVTMWMRVLAAECDSVREQRCGRMCAILSWIHRNENRERKRAHMWNENTAGINTDRTHSQRSNKSVHYIWIRVLGSQSNHTKWLRELHGNFIHMNWPQQHLKHFTRTERNTPTGQSPKQSNLLWEHMSLCLTWQLQKHWQRSEVSKTTFEHDTGHDNYSPRMKNCLPTKILNQAF